MVYQVLLCLGTDLFLFSLILSPTTFSCAPLSSPINSLATHFFGIVPQEQGWMPTYKSEGESDIQCLDCQLRFRSDEFSNTRHPAQPHEIECSWRTLETECCNLRFLTQGHMLLHMSCHRLRRAFLRAQIHSVLWHWQARNAHPLEFKNWALFPIRAQQYMHFQTFMIADKFMQLVRLIWHYSSCGLISRWAPKVKAMRTLKQGDLDNRLIVAMNMVNSR